MLLIFQKVLNQVWTYWLSPIWNNWAVCGYDSAAIKSLSNIHSPCRMLCAWLKGKHMGRARNKMGILKLGMCLQGLLPPDGVEADPGCCRQGVCTQLLFPHTCKTQELPWIKAISGDSNKAFPAVHSWTAEGHGNYRHTAQNVVKNSGRGYQARTGQLPMQNCLKDSFLSHFFHAMPLPFLSALGPAVIPPA